MFNYVPDAFAMPLLAGAWDGRRKICGVGAKGTRESETGAAVAGGNDHDAGLGGARTGDGPLGLRRATAKRKGKKCKYQGLTRMALTGTAIL